MQRGRDTAPSEIVTLHALGFAHTMAEGRSTCRHTVPLHKLVMPLDGCTLTVDDGLHHRSCRGPIFVPQGVAQAMRSDGPTVAVLLDTLRPADRQRPAHRAVAEVPGVSLGGPVTAPIRALTGPLAKRLIAMAEQLYRHPQGAGEVLTALDALLLRPARLDRRVGHVVEQLIAANAARPSNATLAASVRLSPSRMSHLFRQQSEVSVRAFCSYLRVRRGLLKLLGESPTIAAAAADSGFADQAHLTRMCKSRFGRTPNAVRRSMRLSFS